MKFCVVGGLEMVILRFEFHQNQFSGFGAVGVEICPSPLNWPLAYTTACTTVQAVTCGVTLSVDGDADAAMEARISKGWNKFRQLEPLLTNKDVSHLTSYEREIIYKFCT